MLSRSVQWTACLLLALAFLAPAQATNEPDLGEVDAVLAFLGDNAGAAQDTLGGLVPPADPAPSPAGNTLADAESAVQQLQQRADATARQLQQTADPKALRDAIDQALSPIHTAVGDAQSQVDGLLASEDTPRDEESGAITPQSSIKSVWPDVQEPVLLFGAAVLGLGILLWFVGQSATVGAGAAGSAALRDGRKFLPYASPMFTRFEKDTVLGHPKREALYGTIVGEPGVTLQDLCEQSGLSRTAVTHHLRLLEHQHLIVSKRVGRSRHFFENGGRYGRDQKEAYAVLHNDRSKDIHAFIQANPGAIQKDLCSKFDIQASVAHWHVKRLLEANLLEAVRQGRTVSYFPSTDLAAPAYA